MRRLAPRSLLGQMLLSVALALLVAQGISAYLLYRATEQRRELGYTNNLVYQLIAQPEVEIRQSSRNGGMFSRRLRVEHTTSYPLRPGELRDKRREEQVRTLLTEQGISAAQVVVTERNVKTDAFMLGRLVNRPDLRGRPEFINGQWIVAGLLRPGSNEWTIARVARATNEPSQLPAVLGQTLILYIILVGGLALLLRRITRPLAALTRRVETFGTGQASEQPLEPTGPEDARRLITAHNAMEARIAALLDEKDVMLGAIGHDLKTPLAALRVRIESVEDPAERTKMADTIEDITRSLDDILSLARVGRPSDPLERTDLSALVASVVEEYEDMGEPVMLGDTQRIIMPLRTTWLRRALRNLIGNAVRYGERAEVSLVRDRGEAVIRIADHGPGIAQGDIARMLEPFSRGETSRNRVTGGAGLGLTLARAIADQHGGRLVLANRSGRGDAHGPSAPLRTGLVAELRLPLD